MKITETKIKVKELVDGYENDGESTEGGVYAYGGKLTVRPKYQRSFVYNEKQRNAVIDTALKGYPLNIMYWVKNDDGTFECLDGQQRTISLCEYAENNFSYKGVLSDDKQAFLATFSRNNPDLVERFMNYELTVFVCEGTKNEQLEWFKTINIAGEELTNQELRNINYTSAWLTDAKRYFSRGDSTKGTMCPAEQIGKPYTKGDANRQELLEQVISWRVGSKEDEDICAYMNEHCGDEDASDLWNYFNEVINWVKDCFPGEYDKAMKQVQWGLLYNEFRDCEYDPDELINELEELSAEEDITASKSKIYEYLFRRDESLLSIRKFSDADRRVLYTRQKGICPECGEHFDIEKMEAHHIKSWVAGGRTIIDNGIMLCKKCHRENH